MDPSPIPRWDVPKLNDADNLFVSTSGNLGLHMFPVSITFTHGSWYFSHPRPILYNTNISGYYLSKTPSPYSLWLKRMTNRRQERTQIEKVVLENNEGYYHGGAILRQ